MWEGGGTLFGQSVDYTPDGSRLLCCCGNTVRIISVTTGEQVGVLRGHTGRVSSIVAVGFSSSNAEVAVHHCWTASVDGTIRLWDCSSCTLMRTVPVGYPVVSMVIPALKLVERDESAPAQLLGFVSVWHDKPSGGSKANRRVSEDGSDASQRGRLLLINLITGQRLPGHLSRTMVPCQLAVSPSGGLVGHVDGRKVLIWRTVSKCPASAKELACARLHHTKQMKVLAFSPNERQVATGDSTGRILVWHGFGEQSVWEKLPAASISVVANGKKSGPEVTDSTPAKSKPSPGRANSTSTPRGGGVRGSDDAEACTTMHWHAQEVKSLAFSEDGAYLLSGGREAVLVMWQLETGSRQYFPRLGGSLVGLVPSPQPSLYAVQLDDNSIKVLNMAAMKVVMSFQGVCPRVQVSAHVLTSFLGGVPPVEAVVEPRKSHLVLPTQQAGLQFFDVGLNRHVGEVQVVPRNFIQSAKAGPTSPTQDYSSADRHQAAEPSTWVSQVAFSGQGDDMATVEVRIPEEDIGRSTSLKFWSRSAAGSRVQMGFSVNTRVEDPHSGPVTALAFHPSRAMVVSTSSDGDFRIWVKMLQEEVARGGSSSSEFWRCRSVGSFRKEPLAAAAFSADGSLLAVASCNTISLWSPATNALLCVLPKLHSEQEISSLQFCPESPFLVAVSGGAKPVLAVWNLLTMSVWWAYAVYATGLCVDPIAARFAVIMRTSRDRNANADCPEKTKKGGNATSHQFVSAGHVVVFDAGSPTPVAAWAMPEAEGASMAFLPPAVGQSPELRSWRKNKEPGGNPSDSYLLVMSASRDFVILDSSGKEEEEVVVEDTDKVIATEGLKVEASSLKGPSAFEAMYGAFPAQAAEEPAGTDLEENIRAGPKGDLSKRPWASLLNGPSHVLPPLTRIFPSFMETMLQKVAIELPQS